MDQPKKKLGRRPVNKKALHAREMKLAKTVNTFITWLNRSELGCRVSRRKKLIKYTTSSRLDEAKGAFEVITVNIEGVAKGGRAIYIQVERILPNFAYTIPERRVRKFMCEMEEMGAIVGVAYDYSDCWEIITEGKRLKRTYSYRKGIKDGPTKEDSSRDDLDGREPNEGTPNE